MEATGMSGVSESTVQEFGQAILAGETATVRELLDAHPALVESSPRPGMSALTLATYSGATRIAEMLLARGAEVDIFLASALGQTDRMMTLLEETPDVIAAHSTDGWTPLHLAVHFGQMEAAQLLLARGAPISAHSQGAEANTPLHAAVAGKRAEMAEMLVAAGADVHARDSWGWTALHHAAHEGMTPLVTYLLEHGAELDAMGNDGRTPRQLARDEGHDGVAKALEEADLRRGPRSMESDRSTEGGTV
jgi:ankyrin repeat protein